MKISFFHTKTPRKFDYKPRHYNPEREAREKRRAEMGLDSKLSREDELRIKLASRWHKEEKPVFEDRFKRLKFIIYAVVIVAGIYVLFFTHVIENLIKGLGVH